MLLQFSVENVLSFKDRAVLSMVAAEGVEHTEEQVVRLPGLDLPVLKIAAIYGANASGKSNLVRALSVLRRLVVEGVRPNQPLGQMGFKLSAESRARPSCFGVDLFLAGERWSYGIEVSPVRVEAEWLLRIGTDGVEQTVFEREAGEGTRPKIEVGDGFRVGPERAQFLRFVAEGTRHEQPFLAECSERAVVELAAIQEWFVGGIVNDLDRPTDAEVDRRIAETPELLPWVVEALRKADTGIVDLRVRREKGLIQLRSFQRLIDSYKASRSSGRNRGLGKVQLSLWSQDPDGGEFEPASGRNEADLDNVELIRIEFVHYGDPTVTLSRREQSDGTLRLLQLFVQLWDLAHSGKSALLLIDELDRSLHTLIARQFLTTFQKQVAGTPVQLVFTTHDTNLLDLNLLPQDNIWFTKKDKQGATTIYSLAEFKPEQIQALGPRLENGYLLGRFGGIPSLAQSRLIDLTRGT